MRGSTRSPLSCWLATLLLMVLFSLFFNGFEGRYVTSFFGDVGSVKDKSSFRPPPRESIATKNETILPRPTNAPKVDPLPLRKVQPVTPITLPRSSYVSVHEHRASSNATLKTESSQNSFSTWLDFDEKDPAPSMRTATPDDPQKFVAMWCRLDKSEPWQPIDNWHRRAPAFLMPGASHSGIPFLTLALHDHPSIVKTATKQIHFFIDRPFEKFVTRSEQTLVTKARKAMYSRHYNLLDLKRNESLITFDASPGYLYHSSQVPRRLLCVTPWVKLVVILRNPVDRVLEHYAVERRRGLKLSLEDWIDQDMALMQSVNLINNTVSAKNKTVEDVAWLSYQKKSVAGQLGRSLYVIQLRQWVKAFLRAGRTPDILLIRTDHLALDPDAQYQRVLNFLGLPPMQLKRDQLPVYITHQTRPISNATRSNLEDFFRPYNRKLKALIRKYNLSVD